MPVVEFDTKADFDNAYRFNAPSNAAVKLGYHRSVAFEGRHRPIADNLVRIFGWPTNTNILIVGAGFAWTAEIMEDYYGYTSLITADTSSWIQSAQDTDEESEVDAAITSAGLDPSSGDGLAVKNSMYSPGNRRRATRAVENESLANNGSRNRIRGILGDIAVGITEDVLPTLSDAELLNISDWIDSINANVSRIHVVTQRKDLKLANGMQDPAYNWHTLEEYKALLPNDTFVSYGDWEVL
jgi:hypothetical protein